MGPPPLVFHSYTAIAYLFLDYKTQINCYSRWQRKTVIFSWISISESVNWVPIFTLPSKSMLQHNALENCQIMSSWLSKYPDENDLFITMLDCVSHISLFRRTPQWCWPMPASTTYLNMLVTLFSVFTLLALTSAQNTEEPTTGQPPKPMPENRVAKNSWTGRYIQIFIRIILKI